MWLDEDGIMFFLAFVKFPSQQHMLDVHEHVEVPEVDEREAGGAGDADPGGQDGRAG